jgi:NAD-dependent deacetylase
MLEQEKLIQRAARDLVNAKHAIALTGAGISTESGIRDFRGPDGIWTKNPEAARKAFEWYDRFQADPRAFWEDRLDPQGSMSWLFEYFGELDKKLPNLGHRALEDLEKMGILIVIITQNVDGLHQKAGSRNVIEYHGGIDKFRCIQCNKRLSRDEMNLEELIKSKKLPPTCQCGGVIKDDGVFYGEPIPSDVMRKSQEEALKCDLMLICGTSAIVTPFADLPRIAKQHQVESKSRAASGLHVVEQASATTVIEVNNERTPLTDGHISDYLIQGQLGEILPKIVGEVKKIRD